MSIVLKDTKSGLYVGSHSFKESVKSGMFMFGPHAQLQEIDRAFIFKNNEDAESTLNKLEELLNLTLVVDTLEE